MARLLYNDGLDRYGSLRLDPEGADVLVGRDSSCAVRTTLRSVSRIHCTFRYVDGQCRVFDLGSVNGTFVNNQRVREQVLGDGDVIRCGTSFELRYLERDDVAWSDGWLAVLDRDGALLKRTAHHIALGRGFAFLPERFFETAGLAWVPALFGAAAHQRRVLPLTTERPVEVPGARLRAEPMTPLEPVVWMTDRWAYSAGATVRARVFAPLCPSRRAHVRIARRDLDGGALADLTCPIALDAYGCATLALARLSPGDYTASLSWDGDDAEDVAQLRGRWRVVPARLGVVALDVVAQRWRAPDVREVVLRTSGPGLDPDAALLWQSWDADGTCWERGRAERAEARSGLVVVALSASAEAVVRLTLRADAERAARLEVILPPPPERDPEPVTITSAAPCTRLRLAAPDDQRPQRCGLVVEGDDDTLGAAWSDAEAIVRLPTPPDPTRLEALEALEEVHVAVRPALRGRPISVQTRGVLRPGESLEPELPEGPALVQIGGFARGLPWEGWALRLPKGALRIALDVPERLALGASLDVVASVDADAMVLFQAVDARAEPLLVGRALGVQTAAWVRDLTGALPGGFVARTMHEALDALHVPAAPKPRQDSEARAVQAPIERPPLPSVRIWRRSALVQAVEGEARWSVRLPQGGPAGVRVVATALSGSRWADASVTRATQPAPQVALELPAALGAAEAAPGRVRCHANAAAEVRVVLTCDGAPAGDPARVTLDGDGDGALEFTARPGLWRAELSACDAPERALASAEHRVHVLGAPWAQGMRVGLVASGVGEAIAGEPGARWASAPSVVKAWLALIATWRADDCEAASARLVAAAVRTFHARDDTRALEAALGAWARLSLLWRDGGGFRHRAWPEARTDAGGYDARNRAAALNLLLASALIEQALGVAAPQVAAQAPLRATPAPARWSTLASSTRDLARRANALYGRWERDAPKPRTAAEAWLAVAARGEAVASVCLEVAQEVLSEVETHGLRSAWTSVEEAAFAAALGVTLDAPSGPVSQRALEVARAVLRAGLHPHRWAPMSDHIACLILAHALALRVSGADASYDGAPIAHGAPLPDTLDPGQLAQTPWAFWTLPVAASDDWTGWSADGLHAAWRDAGTALETEVGAQVRATLTLGWEPQRGDVALVMLPACLDHATAPEPCDLIAWMERGEEVAGAIRAIPLEGRPSVDIDLFVRASTPRQGEDSATLVAALVNRYDPARRACAAALRVRVRPLGVASGDIA